MLTAIREFHSELFVQHMEEASFLYAQRLALMNDPELSWRDLDDSEERFEAHIDALVIGADTALEVCMAQCADGDFGELHAALRVFCRQDRQDLAFAALQSMDAGDEAVFRAAVDALKAECPASWCEDLTRIMLGRSPELIPVFAEALAYRRAPIEEPLLRALQFCPPAQIRSVLWALGRVGSDRAKTPLGNFLRGDDEAAAAAACRALIRLGEYHAVRHGLLVAQMKPWPVLALGIGGNHAAVNVLTEIAKSAAVTADALIALGLLGDLGSVKVIFECLKGDCALAAATALQTITGAALTEQVFVPAEIDSDELFDEEREAYEQRGEIPTGPDGQPLGTTIEQVSINPERWRIWLTENRARFEPGLRYRHGHPYSPAALLQCIAAERTPFRIRELAIDELVVRYQAPVSLEPDMPVGEQMHLLHGLKAWLGENQGRFIAGQWYFAGRRME